MKAFHNDKKIKQKYIARVDAHIKADKSVQLVRNYFKKRGYHVTTKSSVTNNGHDLNIIKGVKSFSVEVKTAFFSARSWKVGKTFDKKHDFIAIVFGKDIYFELWDEHKKKCSKNGTRCLTKIASLYV
jgi:HJR/Mrr/RecB family endonuclease